MKKLTLIFLTVFFVQTSYTKAQITLDHVIDPSAVSYLFNPVKISDNETKYYLLDTASNTFSLYNLDFTPFISNIALPFTIYPYYSVIYITRTLFDCDSTNIEFILESPNGSFEPFYIMRTDGTILF